MSIEVLLKQYIISKYETVNKFCEASGIASSTIFTVFRRGINNSTSTTILRICNSLQLDAQALYEGEIKSSSKKKSVRKSKDKSTDIFEYISEMQSADLSYKGQLLTDKQKRMIAYAIRLSIQMTLDESDLDAQV